MFTLADPTVAVEAPYRQHLIDRFGKLTLYSVTADAPLAVDLEQIFVKLTATQRRTIAGAELVFHESWEPEEDAAPERPAERNSAAIAPDGHGTHLAGIIARHPLLSRMPDRAAMTESTLTLSLSEALQQSRCLAVIGAPGAGKTTLLRFLALTFARRQAAERLELEEERLPLFVTLRDFSRFLHDTMPDEATNEPHPELLPRFLMAQVQTLASHLSLPDDFFQERLTHGQCLVLLDGLDEVAEPHQRARVTAAVATCTSAYPGNRFIVTSRPRGYDGEAQGQLDPLYSRCTIRDFDDADMTAFAHNWYAAVTRERLGDTPEALATAGRQADDLLRAIAADARVQALAHNPLLLSVLAMVHQREVGLPQRRAELYDECTDMLLGYWDHTKGGEAARELATYGVLTRGEKRTILEPIALWFHERGAQGLEATQEELEQEIARQFVDLGDTPDAARSRATLFLRVIDERAGLLVEHATAVYAFAHLTFQEYLAARAIADRDDYIAYSLQRLHVPWWREVLQLEVGHLSDVRHYGRRARRLTSDLLRAIRSAGSGLEDVLKRDLLFAVRCLCDTGQLGVDDDLRQSLIDALIALWRTTPYEPQQQEVVALFAYAMPTVDGKRILEELFRCFDDPHKHEEAGLALGDVGSAMPAAADPAVRRSVTAALGKLEIPQGFLQPLAQFWRAQLLDSEFQIVGDKVGRVCDIAYEHLQHIATRLAEQHEAQSPAARPA